MKVHPTYLVWLWLFHYPRTTKEEKEAVELSVSKEPLFKRMMAFILWFAVTFCLLLFSYSLDIDLNFNVIFDLIIIIGTIVIIFCMSSIIWSYFMRKTNLISDYTIEKILRDGIPIVSRRVK